MDIEKTFTSNSVSKKYTLSEREMQILQMIDEEGYFEIQSSYEDDIRKVSTNLDIEEKEVYLLVDYDFLEIDMNAYHLTYVLTYLAKEFLDNKALLDNVKNS